MRTNEIIQFYIILHVIVQASGNVTEEIGHEWDSYDEPIVGSPHMVDMVMNPNININDTADREDIVGPIDPNWDINSAVRDVAYYLRAHKFTDFDRRYYQSIDDAPSRLYEEFPKPPLRTLHWEVHKNCDISFRQCLKYLAGVIKETSLQRKDGTVYVIKENNWTLTNNTEQINQVQTECLEALERENRTFVPFEGPFDRFKWRTTASYYMCWFTMLSKPELMFFDEFCDNFGNCLDEYGTNNKDPRADDSKPFACATYSFCPDSCCAIKHVHNMTDCVKSSTNPCIHAEKEHQICDFHFLKNQDFYSLISNQLNVTCECADEGYEWSSRFGLCVDIDECTRGLHNCSLSTGQTCINLPGSFDCMCQLGLIYDEKTENCVISLTFQNVLLKRPAMMPNATESVLDIIVHALTKSEGCEMHCHFKFIIINLFIYFFVSRLIIN